MIAMSRFEAKNLTEVGSGRECKQQRRVFCYGPAPS